MRYPNTDWLQAEQERQGQLVQAVVGVGSSGTAEFQSAVHTAEPDASFFMVGFSLNESAL